MEFYNKCVTFKEYVDKVCVKHGLTVKDALELNITKEVEKMYKEKFDEGKIS